MHFDVRTHLNESDRKSWNKSTKEVSMKDLHTLVAYRRNLGEEAVGADISDTFFLLRKLTGRRGWFKALLT